MDQSLEFLARAGFNLVTGIAAGYWGIKNRHGSLSNWNKGKLTGSIREYISKHTEKIGELYNKISPPIEHFAGAYGITAICYGIIHSGASFGSAMGRVPNLEAIPALSIIMGGSYVTFDGMTELSQALHRKKIWPAQFLGSCAGFATSVYINNPELFHATIDYFVK